MGTPDFNTSYVSTSARNPAGNASAYDANAANSLSLVLPHLCASGRKSRTSRFSSSRLSCTSATKSAQSDPGVLEVGLYGRRLFVMSAIPTCACTYECACVPRTGMPNWRPASKLDVASNPPRYA